MLSFNCLTLKEVNKMRQMGYLNRSVAPYRDKYALSTHSFLSKDSKLTLYKVTKSNLVRITSEEIKAIRPSAYKYLLP